jgi:DNA-binding response OmpR family regulator
MGGLEVLQKLRENDSHARVIVAIADNQNSSRVLWAEAGSLSFLNKAIRKEELQTAVISEPEGLVQ